MPKYKAKAIFKREILDCNRQPIENEDALKTLGNYFESPTEEIYATDRHEAENILLDKYQDKLPHYDSSAVVFSDDSPKH